VIFITKIENGEQKQEGLCLKCAPGAPIKPVDDVINKMGLSDEDIDNLSGDMMNALSGHENLQDIDPDDDRDDEDPDDEGKTATFPYLNRLFGTQNDSVRTTPTGPGPAADPAASPAAPAAQGGRPGKKKFLDNYCINLNQRAREGKLDAMIGREEELERVIQILNRRQKNNPCLIGEPGVGKTAIAEGLAQRIVGTGAV
jgi:ATP-dependent Clp protease ATP-binding subunit ClpB